MTHPLIEEMLVLADRDLMRLTDAKSSHAARDAWGDFLTHSNRAINRLEGYSRRTGQEQKYKTLLKTRLWLDPVAAYMRTARNAQEHGVEVSVADDPFHSRIAFPGGEMISGPMVVARTSTGEMYSMPAASPVEVISASPAVRTIAVRPSIQLGPVRDRSGTFLSPPHMSVLLSEDEPAAVALARTYLAWVRAEVADFV